MEIVTYFVYMKNAGLFIHRHMLPRISMDNESGVSLSLDSIHKALNASKGKLRSLTLLLLIFVVFDVRCRNCTAKKLRDGLVETLKKGVETEALLNYVCNFLCSEGEMVDCHCFEQIVDWGPVKELRDRFCENEMISDLPLQKCGYLNPCDVWANFETQYCVFVLKCLQLFKKDRDKRENGGTQHQNKRRRVMGQAKKKEKRKTNDDHVGLALCVRDEDLVEPEVNSTNESAIYIKSTYCLGRKQQEQAIRVYG